MHIGHICSFSCRVAAVAGVLLSNAAALAQGSAALADPSRAIGAAADKVLNDAIAALDAGEYAAAESAIAMLDVETLSPFERSRAERVLFNLAYRHEHYDEARAHLQNAIDAGGLTPEEISRARYQQAQLFMTKRSWREGAAAIEAWIASTVEPGGNAYYLLAVAYYQMGDYERALPAVQQAVALADGPQESWLAMLVALQIRREHYADAIPVLQQLITIAPNKKTYWKQLSSAYGRADDYRSALAIMQLEYNAGLLTDEADIRRFADLLLYNEAPERSAQVLEDAIASHSVAPDTELYEKLANSWIAAGRYDKALLPLELAADLAATGELFIRLAELHVQRSDWSGVERALERGIAKGGLKDTDRARFLMGVALFEAGHPQDARAWFELAQQSEKWREASGRYLETIDAERGPRATL